MPDQFVGAVSDSPKRAANDREVVYTTYRDDVTTLRGRAQVRLSPEAAHFFSAASLVNWINSGGKEKSEKIMKNSSRQKVEKSQKIMFFGFSHFMRYCFLWV